MKDLKTSIKCSKVDNCSLTLVLDKRTNKATDVYPLAICFQIAAKRYYYKLKDMEYQSEKYFNDVCKTSFKSSSNNTRKVIKARLKEGYKFEDFKDVIDYKWLEWGIKPIRFSTGQMSDTYLRPSTLFGNHFEEYLQAAWKQEFRDKSSVKSEEKSNKRSKLSF